MLTTRQFANNDDHLHEECGVFGIYNHAEAASYTALGLHALQHRGQEAAGIITFDGKHFHSHHNLGHVADIFGSENIIKTLRGHMAVGHVRYSTTGETLIRNVQPLFADFEFGGVAIGHNGNLTNTMTIRKQLVGRGCLFQSTTDTEVIIHLIAISSYSTFEERIIDALHKVEGAYSLVAMTQKSMIGVRDPFGIRPLILGQMPNGSWIIASETCALDIVGANFIRDVDPGELVIVNQTGLRSIKPFTKSRSWLCIFEYIYFARPDSIIDGISVYGVRNRLGNILAQESFVDADVVIPVPDSGVPAALGYATKANIPFELGIIRNHYIGRTFIEPTETIRHLSVKLKHNVNRVSVFGKRVILVDDSIVRGTTSIKIVEMIRQAGATEVHMRISSPPIMHSCFYGIDTPEQEKLLSFNYNITQITKLLGVDSLAFISIDGLYQAVEETENTDKHLKFCDACFTGDYPIVQPTLQCID
ncbi:MAG: amidophosphoribosyltransferase [Rhodospirillaceae bacterium]|jgi:amidophosphoribosyltransferase|nr:amidophosphoribosyltransferase [Rhodospirillaceae bacterium]